MQRTENRSLVQGRPRRPRVGRYLNKKKTAMRRGVEVEIEEFSSSHENGEERKERIAKMKADLRGKWGSTREENAGATSC